MTNKIEITKKIGTETITSIVNDIYVLREKYTNGELTGQEYRLLNKKHNGYSPQKMSFQYFGPNFDVDEYYNIYYSYPTRYDSLPKQLFVDAKTFTDFDNLYCPWVGMDGNIFRLTEIQPLPRVFLFELWGTYFNPNKAAEHLEKDPKCIDVKVNSNISGRNTVYFKYKADRKETDFLIKNKKDAVYPDTTISKFFNIDQFAVKRKR